MKLWVIIGSIVFSISIVTVFLVFGLPALSNYTNDNTNIGGEIVPNEEDDFNNSENNVLIFSINITEFFVGDILDIEKFFVSSNLNDYEIYIISNNTNVVIDGFKIKSLIDCTINYTIYYRAAGTSNEFSKLDEFSIVYYKYLENIDYVVKPVLMNESTIEIEYDCNIDTSDLKFETSNGVLITENNYSNCKSILNVVLNNVFSGYITLKYLKNDFTKTITLCQNYNEYFKVYNNTTLNDVESLNLYITSDKLNHSGVNYYNDITIINGLKIDNVIYDLQCDLLTIFKIDDSKFRLESKAVGESKLCIMFCDTILYEIDVCVNDVEITNIQIETSYNIKANTTINIAPNQIIPNYAVYTINYDCNNINTSIDALGNFTAFQVGTYNVVVNVNNYEYLVTIEVTEQNIPPISKFYLKDDNGDTIENLDISVGENLFCSLVLDSTESLSLTGELAIQCYQNGLVVECCKVVSISDVLVSIKFTNEFSGNVVFKILGTNMVTDEITITTCKNS